MVEIENARGEKEANWILAAVVNEGHRGQTIGTAQ